MAGQLDLLLEAERRGILPPDKQGLLDEARKRGLVPATESPMQPRESMVADNAPADTAHAGLLANMGYGGLKAATDVGSTIGSIIQPLMVDPLVKLYNGGKLGEKKSDGPTLADLVAGTTRKTADQKMRESRAQFFAENADPDSLGFKAGEIGGGVAATAGVGGALAAGAKAIPWLARLAPALESGGMTLGDGATKSALANALLRAGAGAATGAGSTALLNPEQTGAGAVLGAALPGAAALGGMAGKALGLGVSPEVAALAEKAKAMGIDIPADRLTDSKFMNAVAASLNYLPMSGRAGTEARMLSQLNQAASRTMGEDSANLAQALRNAKSNLGAKFDATLKGTAVNADDALLDALGAIQSEAKRTLVADQSRIIDNQVDDILAKVKDGVIDADAAYNIKRNLDKIAKRNSPEAEPAKAMRDSLIDALNRSLGDAGAAEFAGVRRQYGNMKELSKFARSLNGAEGELSAAKLGSMGNIRSPELQDVADVAAQFVKGRESPHGAMQRLVLGSMGAAASPMGLAPYVAGGMTAGRIGNMALNSGFLKSALTNPEALAAALGRRAELRAIPQVLAAE